MDKAITTSMLIVVSLIVVLGLFNAVYPAVVQSGDAIAGMSARADDRLQTQIEIVHASSERDASGNWNDSNGNGDFDVLIWAKNIGSTRIIALEQADLFFGPEGNYSRIPHQSFAGGYPFWSADLLNAPEWTPTATLQITVHYGTPLGAGRYFIKLTLPNGISDEDFLGI